MLVPKQKKIQEFDVAASAGHGAEVGELIPTANEWSVPDSWIAANNLAGAQLKIISVRGQSMEPLFMSGDKVIVNLNDRMPYPPGVFVFWDGMGLTIKQLEFYLSDCGQKKLSIKSSNPSFQSYELTVPSNDETPEWRIQGRVIGKWLWT